MFDHRIQTFLTLYEKMNYRVTAELLHITQPAVTQHIHYLEKEYDCKLFLYDGKTLTRTEKADVLAQYARSALYNDESLKRELRQDKLQHIRIGATKTIGEYILPEKLAKMLQNQDITISLTVDNTDVLLQMIDNAQLDYAAVEGAFDKEQYGYRLLQMEPFIGICSKSHPFAGREVGLEETLGETLLVREEGSGTRTVLEQLLHSKNYTINNFMKMHTINNFAAMKTLIGSGCGISFAYQSIVEENDTIATFTLREQKVERELNYVYLKYTKAGSLFIPD